MRGWGARAGGGGGIISQSVVGKRSGKSSSQLHRPSAHRPRSTRARAFWGLGSQHHDRQQRRHEGGRRRGKGGAIADKR
ncbi:hypothetical protein IF1G_06136 [Cordyceps javanica]|uniref:Uncharacterized protein n=1 Tax=Cordyceps javanica TaxID=43265 RepID=A0A545V0D6_9HYPO|nr:hypothetical protein IF1G_06136 [Cordyceps javanica]